MSDFVVYGTPVSPFVRKVEAVLGEKHCAYEVEAVNVFDPPDWFHAISPMKTIPVLRDCSVATEGPEGTIADSSAICGFLERRVPSPPIYPEDPFLYGRALFIEELADTRLAATGGLGIFRPIFMPASTREAPDLERAQATWRDKMPAIFDTLEIMLGDAEYLVGEAFSIADISVAVQLMQIELVAEAALQPRWPGLAAHLERTRSRDTIAPSFARAERYIRKILPQRVILDS